MYQKYQTDALVLAGRDIGEADKAYALYTHDFGLVRARGSAVRSEKSRMRYSLQNYSFSNVSLVRGKRGWRVAGARPITLVPADGVHAFARVAELVNRLVPGEEKNEYLYDSLLGAHKALALGDAAAIEILCVARALYSLGYISAEEIGTQLFENAEYSQVSFAELREVREQLLAAINKAISETHL